MWYEELATLPVMEVPAMAMFEADSLSQVAPAAESVQVSLSSRWQADPIDRLAPRLTSPIEGLATWLELETSPKAGRERDG